MKKTFFFTCLLLLGQISFAVTRIAVVNNGNWATAATWNLGMVGGATGVPAAGDDVIIPAGITVVLGANMATAIRTLSIANTGRLNGNNRTLNAVTISITIANGGTMNAINSMTDIICAVNNAGTLAITGDLTWANSVVSGTIFNNSGNMTIGGDMDESSDKYPPPADPTPTTFPSFINSGHIASSNKKIQFDGFFTNTGVITGVSEFHVDGVICNKNTITTNELKVHGGTSQCVGNWIVQTIEFDDNNKQTGSNQNGVLLAGNYCRVPPPAALPANMPAITDPAKGTVNVAVTYCQSVVLPVTWLDFEARLENQVVKLIWHTAAELNNSHFVVQKSTNGFDFVDFGIVSGAGTTKNISEYTFKDSKPYNGLTYYRLKQVDLDSTKDFSKIVAVTVHNNSGSLLVYPNPIEDNHLTVIMPFFDGEKVLITINDMLGKVWYDVTTVYNGDSYSITSNLPTGVYLLTVSNANKTMRQKIVYGQK